MLADIVMAVIIHCFWRNWLTFLGIFYSQTERLRWRCWQLSYLFRHKIGIQQEIKRTLIVICSAHRFESHLRLPFVLDHSGPVPEWPDGISSGQHTPVPRERTQHGSPGSEHSPRYRQHHHHGPGSGLHHYGERAGWNDAPPPQRAELATDSQPPQPIGKQHLTPPL